MIWVGSVPQDNLIPCHEQDQAAQGLLPMSVWCHCWSSQESPGEVINYFQSKSHSSQTEKKIMLASSSMVSFLFLAFPLFCTAVESLHSLNDQISHFIVSKSKTLEEDEDPFLPSEKESLKSAMRLMRHLLMDAQVGNQYTDVC